MAADVEGEEGLEATDARATDENGGRRRRRRITRGVSVSVIIMVNKREGWDLVILELDDGRVHPDGGEELSHDVAHAARGPAEYYDRVFRYQTLDFCLRGFFPVNGQVGGRWGRGEVEVDDVVWVTS